MADVIKVACEISGVAPMLQHNGMLSDPMNSFAKAMKVISSKKKKTDDDFLELSKLEFQGSAYHSAQTGWFLTSDIIEAAIIGGARKRKKGKDFQSSVFCGDDLYPLEFDDSDKTPLELFEIDKYRDVRRVVIPATGNSVQRTRPRIDNWLCKFDVNIITAASVSVDDVKEALDTAAALVGVCDWRPKYGRFEVNSFEVVA